MDGFAITCSTCHARLRVRDDRAVGQILACPRCNSLVLVERVPDLPAAADGNDLPGNSGRRPSNSTDHRFPRCDSFDHIDQLLEHPPRVPAVRRDDDRRWRMAAGASRLAAASDATGGNDSSIPAVPINAGACGEPTAAEIQNHATSSTGFRPYLFLCAGAVTGAVLGLGTAGWILTRSAPAEVAQAAASEPEAPADQAPSRPVQNPSSNDRESDEASIEVVGPQTESPVAEAGEVAVDNRGDEQPVAEQEPPDAGPTDEVAAEERPPNPPAVVVDHVATPTSPTQTDDLSAFAHWLQDADVTPMPTAAAGSAEPPTEPAPTSDPNPPGPVVPLQPSRSPPPPINVVARLDESVTALKLEDVPLLDALRWVTQFSTIPIYIDSDALGRRNLRADQRVSLIVRDLPVRELLDQLLAKAGLGWAPMDGYVMVTTQPDARGELVTIRHDVRELTQGKPAETAALAAWVTQLIEFGGWPGQSESENEVAGSVPRCEVEGSVLVVTHRDTVQFKVLELCEKLRVSRGLPPRTRMLKDRLALGLRSAGCTALQQSVSLRTARDQNFDQIATALGRQLGVQILVDWPALHAAGWSPADRERFFAEQLSLHEALTRWLQPIGLIYRVVDSQTLEITTLAALAGTHDVEFYPLAGRVETGDDVRRVSQQIMRQLGEATFQPAGSGAIAYDELSRTLIVSLPQHQQQTVHALIESLSNATGPDVDR